MMQEASKRRCSNKIKFISLSFLSKSFSQKILIKTSHSINNISNNITCNNNIIYISSLTNKLIQRN